jgi:hypothetical protein
MRTVATLLRNLGLAALLSGSAVCASPAPPAAKAPQAATPEVAAIQKQLRELDRATEEAHTRAVVRIERPEGVCYWQVLGSDALLRMPVKDPGFANLLMSAKVVKGGEIELTVAGEIQPLETTSLSRLKVSLPTGEAADKDREDPQVKVGQGSPWRLSLIPASDFFKSGIAGCCQCTIYKVTCCPTKGNDMACGTCGDCCGD